MAYHTKTDNAPLITQDKIWLLSYPEVHGTEPVSFYLNGNSPSDYEGTQYEYMKTVSNRLKYVNYDGTASSTRDYYWLRSPSSISARYGFYWCYINDNGIATSANASTAGLAPAFCL